MEPEYAIELVMAGADGTGPPGLELNEWVVVAAEELASPAGARGCLERHTRCAHLEIRCVDAAIGMDYQLAAMDGKCPGQHWDSHHMDVESAFTAG
jgi:hypothetical protein